MGVDVIASITGDGRVDDIRRAHHAKLNVVQCSGSMTRLAKHMEERYGIPFIRVSWFGLEDTAKALYDVAAFFNDRTILDRTRELVRSEVQRVQPRIAACARDLANKSAGVYVGGAFKAFSLVKSLRGLGMETVLAGSQTGNAQDYEVLRALCSPGTIIIDDATTLELARFLIEKKADLFIGGVKERPIAYKLGIGFCDHNHERKTGLAGFEGAANFAEEVHATVMSPVWRFVPRHAAGGGTV
jgi:nitrogenase molybdenum-cofactor synthesis protein NifE